MNKKFIDEYQTWKRRRLGDMRWVYLWTAFIWAQAPRTSDASTWPSSVQQIPLQELRLARAYSQQTLASAMGVPQSAISKIERRTDAYVSTLRKYLHAMGGELEIIAAFPDGSRVKIDQFQEIGDPVEALVQS